MENQNSTSTSQKSPGFLAHLILILVSTICLTLGFCDNRFGVANQNWFEHHQKDTEGHVIGNLVRSSSHGLWEHSGLNGITQIDAIDWKLERPWNSRGAWHQYQFYLEEESNPNYNPYYSQPGAQAWIFVALDRLLESPPKERLKLYRWITSFCSAFSLALILSWLLRVAGWGASIVAGISMLYSPWMTVFGGNLWWFFASFFLPMVVVAFATSRKHLSLRFLFIISLTGLLIKCMLTGFEYISTTLVMSQIPLLLDTLRRNDDVQTSLSKLFASSLGAIVGTLLTVGILWVQISSFRGDPMAGIEHILYSFDKRSNGSEKHMSRPYNRHLDANVEKVIETYRKGVCFDLDSKTLKEREDPSKDSFLRPFRFEDLFSTLKHLSWMWLLWAWISKKYRWALISFLLATWASLLAPMSWFIIFKAHSVVHTHMNHVCWHMPFSFMVAAMVGCTAQSILKLLLWPFHKFWR